MGAGSRGPGRIQGDTHGIGWGTIRGARKEDSSQNQNKEIVQELQERASLVAQWLRICLPMQGTQV